MSGATKQLFQCSPMSCQGTLYVQTFCILSYCNTQTIIALLTLCEKCAAISHCMSVIVRQQSSLRIAHMHRTVSCNVVLSHPLCLSSCTFVLPSQNIDCHSSTFLRLITFSSLKAAYKRWWIFTPEFFFMVKKQTTLRTPQKTEFLSDSSFHKPNTKNSLNSLEIFCTNQLTILRTCTRFCCISVTKMREKIDVITSGVPLVIRKCIDQIKNSYL